MCAVKLDMHKAYDRVEWGFLRDVMLKLGFDKSWVQMIMACVTSVNYWVWFNSEETDIYSNKGSTTGRPLVPLSIFDMC